MYLFYFVSAFILLNPIHGWIIQVDSYSQECFIEQINSANTKIWFSFQVVDGGFLEIDVNITAPSSREIYVGTKESNGKFVFTASEEGKHSFCFSNEHSSQTTKQVMFDILVEDAVEHVTSADEIEVLTNETSKMQGMVAELKHVLTAVSQEQAYIMGRLNFHRRLSEHVNRVVVRWALFETGIILTGAALQVWYLTRFFEIRSII